ncbi:unnamed protein product [Adineta steineri]|uniref:Uncharacterized protein n=1 Tax=Adineta steineri TaxID=433720 RepID=A0A818RT30_9BILA|nr:unnamed protein product [Adineta steineri]CAF3662814.1 unnamed protein product [Adineta steineri]
MTTNRFQVTSVNELNRDKLLSHPSEVIPLINIQNDIPTPPSLPISFTSIHETNKTSTRLKASSTALNFIRKLDPIIHHSNSHINLPGINETDGGDSCYSTIQSNTWDTNSLHLKNNFLHELRLKRHELQTKAKNIPIDQRIALNNRPYNEELLRAQDIFAIHFELNDTENIPDNIFNEDSQEKIRNKIFDELDRQRKKKFHKQHRQLFLGRALLFLMVAILVFMATTLICAVMNLYDRAEYFNITLSNDTFLSMIYDTSTNT